VGDERSEILGGIARQLRPREDRRCGNQAVGAQAAFAAGVVEQGSRALRDGPGPAGTLLSAGAASELRVSVGDTVTLRSISGEERPLTVIGTYRNTALAGPALVPLDIARDIRADGTFEVAAIRLRPGAPAFWVQRRVGRMMEFLPKVRVSTPEQFAALSTSIADAAVRIVSVMLVGTLGIGVLGLATTLALSTLERRRELVMLRAVGAGRRQVQVLVWLEATMIGFIAAIVGIGAGTGAARLATGFVPESLAGSPAIPWSQLAAVAVGAVLTAWAVSLGVARRASQVPPAEAGRM
jgi:putative ABC transport system permease protein